jgi:hypothetical protein
MIRVSHLVSVVGLPYPKLKTKGWPQEATDAVVAAVKSKFVGYLRGAKTHRVPCDTLESYVKQCTGGKVNASGRNPIFKTELETDLVNHCLQMEQRFVGFSCSGIKQIRFRLEKENGIPNFLPTENGRAGKK